MKLVPTSYPRIVVCLPGSSFSATFLGCWSEFLTSAMKNNIELKMSQAQDAVVYYVRNKALGGSVLRGVKQKPFDGKIPYDYMLWIDSDIVFSFDHFVRLINHNLDIVSGMYLMQGGTHFATVKNWDTQYFLKKGAFEFMTPADIQGKKDLIPVEYTGFGFILIKYCI